MGKSALIIFQKNAVLGKVKTRISVDVGDQVAMDIYQQLVRHTHEVCVSVPVQKFLFFSDFIPDDVSEFDQDYKFEVQTGNDLGSRMGNAFQFVFANGYEKILILGTDCGELESKIVVKAFELLNKQGYGISSSGLILNLVYNPSGAFLPGSQEGLELEFKKKLKEKFDIQFNSLYAITNIPISRFLEYLIRSDNYESYMEKLVENFNPTAAEGVMCRNTISVGWDGYLYDCDFNQMLELKVDTQESQHISEWNLETLSQREIVVRNHCFGCTAGSGSSCGGTTA